MSFEKRPGNIHYAKKRSKLHELDISNRSIQFQKLVLFLISYKKYKNRF